MYLTRGASLLLTVLIVTTFVLSFVSSSPAEVLALTFSNTVTIQGDLSIQGSLSKGSGTFMIDDPADPKNKLLFHSFVESSDVLNLYSGTTTLDETGSAHIELPAYFLALNTRAAYFASPLHAAMPDLHLSSPAHRKFFGLFGPIVFSVAGGAPYGEISWIATGIRKDPYILAHPIIPEVTKGPLSGYAQGAYVHPEAYATSTH